jgi:hypothetical protein
MSGQSAETLPLMGQGHGLLPGGESTAMGVDADRLTETLTGVPGRPGVLNLGPRI